MLYAWYIFSSQFLIVAIHPDEVCTSSVDLGVQLPIQVRLTPTAEYSLAVYSTPDMELHLLLEGQSIARTFWLPNMSNLVFKDFLLIIFLFTISIHNQK